jgi:hypothetical protein
METIIIAVIILAAVGFSVYKIFFRPSCSCGCGCGKKKKWDAADLHVQEDPEE